MARCKSCSAPLAANTNLCRYCGIRNDVDLHGKHQYSTHSQQSERICPECDVQLQTIDLKLNELILIERCEKCFGLFFEPGEIETILENSVSNVYDINRELIQNINRDRYQGHNKFKYIKCPVCRVLMNRVNFGHRSGVIMDQCRKHGIWLDNGEISHLMEWKKAGGQMLHEQKSAQRLKKSKKSVQKPGSDFSSIMSSRRDYGSDLIESLSSLVYRLFD